MSDLDSLKKFQRARKKRRSLEEKTKILEENARRAKLSIDRQLLVQILQEENRAHDAAVKELDEKLQEENHTHRDTIKELEEKIADLEKQIKPSSEVESIPSETPSEPTQDMSEPTREISTEVDEDVRIARVRALLQESARSESEVPQEAPREKPKKRKRGLF